MNPELHFTAGTVADYRSRRLDPMQILALHDHAEVCAACRELLMAGTASVRTVEHLGEQEAVDYVAGKVLNPALEEHLAQCAECRLVVDDLRSFEAELERPAVPKRPYWHFAAAAAVLFTAGAAAWVMRPHQTGPVLVSSLQDGAGIVGLTAAGEVTGVEGLSDSTTQLMRAALQSGRLPASPAIAAGAAGTLRTAQPVVSEFRVLSPRDTREFSDRPVFRWTPLPGAASYEVVVFDADLNEVARSGKITGTEWQPVQPLPRQRALQWQVATEHNGRRMVTSRPPEPVPMFEIIPAETAQSIAAARAAAHPSHLALALLYAQAGLRTEEKAEVGILTAQNPHSPVVEELNKNLASNR